MPEILLQDILITYTITRSRRSTLSMTMRGRNEVEIRAPWIMPELFIKQFIRKHESWILKRLKKNQEGEKNALQFVTGEKIPFFGEEYPLYVTKTDNVKVVKLYFLNNTFQIYVSPEMSGKEKIKECRKLLHKWYLANSLEKFEARTSYYAQMMGETYHSLRVKDVMTLWGSCSRRRNINFNYRLAALPLPMIDYVIIHELCHLKEMNHSSRFWALVEKYLPTYKKIRAEMKKRSMEIE